MKTLATLAAVVALAFSMPAAARNAEGVIQHLVAPTALDPDKAYLLFQSSKAQMKLFKIGHVFLRIPTQKDEENYLAAKRAAYDKELARLQKKGKGAKMPAFEDFEFYGGRPENRFAVDMGEPLGTGDTYFVEVPAGTYVLYGAAVGTAYLVSCNCLGTVKFEAKAGVITRLGGLFADRVDGESPIPHLEDNLGDDLGRYGTIIGQALVPATQETPVPAGLAGFPKVLAEYKPVGMFPNPGAEFVNRLAPIPGILEYDRGRVILGSED